MSDDGSYRIVFRPEVLRQFLALREQARHDPRGRAAQLIDRGISGVAALRAGREAELNGERLGRSARHADLRDCAEIKIAVFAELATSGRRRGPSHRMIYREFDGTPDDPRPVRQVVAYEHRKGGRPFAVAAERLGRPFGTRLAMLDHIPSSHPSTGPDKDPNRPVTPPRLPLPPDVAAALSTSKAGQTRSRGNVPARHTPKPGRIADQQSSTDRGR